MLMDTNFGRKHLVENKTLEQEITARPSRNQILEQETTEE